MGDERQRPLGPDEVEPVPLEAHIVALRAELERSQLTLRIATAALLVVALTLAWRAYRDNG